jgi:hypothetical protein
MEDKKYQALLARLEKAEKNAQIARDWVEISNLHGRYNHLCLGHYWERICDELFAQKTPGVKAEIVESGVFHGIEGVKKVFIEMLGVPDEMEFVIATPLGYPVEGSYEEAARERLSQRTRKELKELVYNNAWGKPF